MSVVKFYNLGEESSRADYQAGAFSVVVCTYKRAGSLGRFLDSVGLQECKPTQLIIVDASPDDETEQSVRKLPSPGRLAPSVQYFHVAGDLVGLTRQRNFAVSQVKTDLVAFFDDDIVLRPACLREMLNAHTSLQGGVVGVCAYIENASQKPEMIWRLRRFLHIVSTLTPGSYQRSGMSVPWSFMSPTNDIVEGDWLLGGATMWRTREVRELKFCELFRGYAQGEDLDFSLRARTRGKLVVAGSARALHFHESSGRPNRALVGYMAIYNRYVIHQRGLENRTWKDVLWFIYGWSLDTILLVRHFLFPGRIIPTVLEMGGRLKAVLQILARPSVERQPENRHAETEASVDLG